MSSRIPKSKQTTIDITASDTPSKKDTTEIQEESYKLFKQTAPSDKPDIRKFVCAEDARPPLVSSNIIGIVLAGVTLVQVVILWLVGYQSIELWNLTNSSVKPPMITTVIMFLFVIGGMSVCSILATSMVAAGGGVSVTIIAMTFMLAVWYIAGIFYFSMTVPDREALLNSQLYDLLSADFYDGSLVWDKLQADHECCGMQGHTDWTIVPKACCSHRFNTLYAMCKYFKAFPPDPDASRHWYNLRGCYPYLRNKLTNCLFWLEFRLLYTLVVHGFGFLVLNSQRIFQKIVLPMKAILRAPAVTGLERVTALHPDPFRYLKAAEHTVHYRETILDPSLKRPSRLSRFDIAEMVRPHASRPPPVEPCPAVPEDSPEPEKDTKEEVPTEPPVKEIMKPFHKSLVHCISPKAIRKAIAQKFNKS